MFSSMVGIAMTAMLTSSVNLPAWQMDYRNAKEMAARDHRPLAVVIGTGSTGWDAVVPMVDRTADAMRTGYVCVYVDKSTPAGRKLAGEFEMSDTVGVVISDRTGEFQAFRHSGRIDEAELVRATARYADPAYRVLRTETVVPEQPVSPVGYYQSQYAAPQSATSAPAQSSCPNCQRAQAYHW